MSEEPSREAVRAFLERRFDANLIALGALIYEPLEAIRGFWRGSNLVAVGVIVSPAPNVPEALPTVLLDADDFAALDGLLHAELWPTCAIWVARSGEELAFLETWLGTAHTPEAGLIYFASSTPPHVPEGARQLDVGDVRLDLAPCSLSSIALSYWMLRGWRVFGWAENGRLLGHALAAYPIGTTEEVSAVFTAPEARRRGIASACAAAAIADICMRQHRAVYVSRRDNTASIGVAEGLGMQRILETWEIEG